jgi:hypothetical protein
MMPDSSLWDEPNESYAVEGLCALFGSECDFCPPQRGRTKLGLLGDFSVRLSGFVWIANRRLTPLRSRFTLRQHRQSRPSSYPIVAIPMVAATPEKRGDFDETHHPLSCLGARARIRRSLQRSLQLAGRGERPDSEQFDGGTDAAAEYGDSAPQQRWRHGRQFILMGASPHGSRGEGRGCTSVAEMPRRSGAFLRTASIARSSNEWLNQPLLCKTAYWC